MPKNGENPLKFSLTCCRIAGLWEGSDGGKWPSLDAVPFFYRDFDVLSAKKLGFALGVSMRACSRENMLHVYMTQNMQSVAIMYEQREILFHSGYIVFLCVCLFVIGTWTVISLVFERSDGSQMRTQYAHEHA